MYNYNIKKIVIGLLGTAFLLGGITYYSNLYVMGEEPAATTGTEEKTDEADKQPTISDDMPTEIKEILEESKSTDRTIIDATEWAMSDWQAKKSIMDNFRKDNNPKKEKHSVSRVQNEGNLSNSSTETPLPTVSRAERERFINQSPDIKMSSRSSDTTTFMASGPSSPAKSPMLTSSGNTTFANPITQDQPTVNYSGDITKKIPLAASDILISDAIVELPKGEGYEALISANGQGLLVELGVYALDKDGKPTKGTDGKPILQPLKRGLRVSKGQFLGKQNDREHAANKAVAEQQLIVAEKEANKTLEVEVARLAVLVAQSEYQRAESANKQVARAVAEEEVVQRAYEYKRADKSAEKAEYDLEIKAHEVDVRKAQVVAADAQVVDRQLISPIDGFIDDIMQNEGQWLREGDNILKIVRLDKVQICGKIDAQIYTPEMIDGRNVTIYVQKPGDTLKKIEGTITYARQIIESGKFYFYAEANNIKNDKGYWLLNPGTIVTMVIHR